MDDRRERSDDDRSDAHRSALDRRAIQGRGAGQHPASAPVERQGRILHGSAEGNRCELLRDGFVPLDAERVDDRRWDSCSGSARPARLVSVAWSKFRGPGDVTFSNAAPSIDEKTGQSTTTATFSARGDYILRVQVNDATGEGGGGFQCCWTNAHIKVTVK